MALVYLRELRRAINALLPRCKCSQGSEENLNQGIQTPRVFHGLWARACHHWFAVCGMYDLMQAWCTSPLNQTSFWSTRQAHLLTWKCCYAVTVQVKDTIWLGSCWLRWLVIHAKLVVLFLLPPSCKLSCLVNSLLLFLVNEEFPLKFLTRFHSLFLSQNTLISTIYVWPCNCGRPNTFAKTPKRIVEGRKVTEIAVDMPQRENLKCR